MVLVPGWYPLLRASSTFYLPRMRMRSYFCIVCAFNCMAVYPDHIQVIFECQRSLGQGRHTVQNINFTSWISI